MGTTDAQRHQMKLIKNLRIHHLQFPISIAANASAAPGDFGAPAFATRAQQQQQQRLAKAVYLRHMSHQSAAAAAAAAAPPPAAGTFRSTCHIHSQSHVSQSSVGRGRVSSSSKIFSKLLCHTFLWARFLAGPQLLDRPALARRAATAAAAAAAV